MKTINLRNELFFLALLVIPLLYLYVVWNRMPDIVPVHFNAAGHADSRGSKTTYIWLVSVPGLIFYLLLFCIPLLRKPLPGQPSMGAVYNKIRTLVSVSNCVIYLAIVHAALSGTMTMERYIIFASLALVVISVVVIIVRSGSVTKGGQAGGDD